MIMLKEYNNVIFIIRCIDETNDSEYRNDFLNRVMYIYRVSLTIKSFFRRNHIKRTI